MISLREHQIRADKDIDEMFQENRCVLDVLPTGAGKTFIIAHRAKKEIESNNKGFVLIFAHQQVLLRQISEALCIFKLKHNFIVSNKSKKIITESNLDKFGDSYCDDTGRAKIIVCMVDKFMHSIDQRFCDLVTFAILDEAHHLIKDGKWHKCIKPLRKSKILGLTATPNRSDGKYLGASMQGMFEDMRISATTDELIQKNLLAPYTIYIPPCKIDFRGLRKTSTGDYNSEAVAERTSNAKIVGDVVKHYLKIAPGKKSIYFTVNIAESDKLASEFRKKGVKAVSLSSKTTDNDIDKALKQFESGVIDIIVNCALFGEGFNAPTVEVIGFVRKTASFTLFKQQFGRGLRVSPGKKEAIIIDHVGNIIDMMVAYKLSEPHQDPDYSLIPLKAPNRKKNNTNVDSDIIEMVTCGLCHFSYIPTSAKISECPKCNQSHDVEDQILNLKVRQADLVQYSVEKFDNLIKKRKQVDLPVEVLRRKFLHAKSPPVIMNSAIKNHRLRQDSQILLRDKIQKWCVKFAITHYELTPKLVQIEFQKVFGVHPVEAVILGAKKANELTSKIDDNLRS